MMKRAITIFLTAIMLITSFSCICIVSAKGEGTQMYWDFENVTIEELKETTGGAFYTGGTVEIAAGGANGSANALKIIGSNSGNGQWITGLEPCTAYTVYYWAKAENRGINAWPNVGVSDYDGSANVSFQDFTDTWAQYSLEFTTGAGSTQAKIYTWVFGTDYVDFFIDDVIVVKKASSELEFWNAEANVPALLQTMPGYYSAGNVTIAADGAEDSEYSVHISGANSGNGSYINGLTPNTSYEITFWAKIADCATGAYPNVGVSDYGNDYQTVGSFTRDWSKYSMVFTTGTDATTAKFYTWVFGEGNAELYVDNVSIAVKQAEPANPLEAWNCEHNDMSRLTADPGYYASGDVSIVAGGANGSAYALKISGANSGNGQQLNGLEPNTTYTVSLDAKQENNEGTAYPSIGVKKYNGTDDYVTAGTIANEWTHYTIEFKTGEESTSALFYTWIFGTGAVDLLIDNVSLTKKTDAPHEGPYLVWDFESGKVEDLGTANSSDADGYYAFGNVSVVSGGDNSAYCLKISGVNSGNGQRIEGLESGTDYVLSFRARNESRDETAYPNLGVKGYDGDQYKVADSFNAEWGTYIVRFTTGLDSTSACVYSWIFGEGNAEFLVDNLSVVKASDYIDNPDELPTKSILFIGNSFSNNAFAYCRQIGEASGVNFVVGNLWIPGSTLEQRWDALIHNKPSFIYERTWDATEKDHTVADALADREWDYIVLQQMSLLAGVFSSWEPEAHEFIEYFAEHQPNAEIVVYQTWGYSEGCTAEGFEDFNCDTETMTQAIITATKQIAKAEHLDMILPVGSVFRTLRADGFDVTKGEPDLRHANDLGCYAAGQTIFSMVTGIMPSEDSFMLGRLTGEEAALVRAAIIGAVQEYRDYRAYDDPTVIVPDLDIPDEPDWQNTFAAWDFESGNAADLGTPATGDDGYYATGDVSIVPGGMDGSVYCLKISGANCGNGQFIYGLAPETTYTISFDAKQENNAGAAFPSIGVKKYNGTDDYVTAGKIADEWTHYTIEFTTGVDCTGAQFYTWIFGEGDVDLYLDNVSIAVKQTEPTNPLEAWNCEHNDMSRLTADPGYYASGDVSIVAGGANNSAYALRISGANSGNGQWLNGLEPDCDYAITFWAKVENRGEDAWPNVGVSDYDGGAYFAEQNFTDEWAQYTLRFTTGAESTQAKFYTWIFGSGVADLYLDDIALTKAPHTHSYTAQVTKAATCGEPGIITYICACGDSYTNTIPATGEHNFQNGVCTVCGTSEVSPISLNQIAERWTFEHNNLALLGTADGNDADGYYAVGDVSIVSGGAKGSAYCLRINGAEHGNGQWFSGLKPNTKYTLTFWAKVTGVGSNAYPNFGINGYDGSNYQAIDSFSGDWTEYVIVFSTGKDSTSACIYSWIFGSGSATLYVDDVSVMEGAKEEPGETPAADNQPQEPVVPTQKRTTLKGWDFEDNDIALLGTPDGNDADGYYAVGDVSIVSGGAEGSLYCLKVSGAEHGNGQWLTGLKPGTGYTLTFWAKISNWGGMAYPTFGVNGYDGDNYSAIDTFKETWEKYSLSFVTGSESTTACVYSWIFGSGAVDFYVDNVTLLETANIEPEHSEPGGNIEQQGQKDVGVPEMKNESTQAYTFVPSAEGKTAKWVGPLIIVASVLGVALLVVVVFIRIRKKRV